MKPSIFRPFILAVGMASTMLGLMVLLDLGSVQALTVAVSRSMNTAVTIVRSQPELSGGLLLFVGASLCLMLLFE